MMPTLTTSMGNTAAASGVPNMAEKAADMPVMTRVFRPRSEKLEADAM